MVHRPTVVLQVLAWQINIYRLLLLNENYILSHIILYSLKLGSELQDTSFFILTYFFFHFFIIPFTTIFATMKTVSKTMVARKRPYLYPIHVVLPFEFEPDKECKFCLLIQQLSNNIVLISI